MKQVIKAIGLLFLATMATFSWVMPVQATGVYDIPTLSELNNVWTIDEGDVLSRSTESSINSKLGELAQQTGNEVRLVTIRRLDYDETIASFTEKLFKTWFPSEDLANNQTVVVLDTITNNGSIMTGAKNQDLLTAETQQSITTETLQIPLREGDKYNESLLGVSDRLAAILSGQPDPGPPKFTERVQVERTYKTAKETDTTSATVVVVVLLILATVIPMVTYFYYQRS